jgi:hypothetical protein
MLLLTAAEAFRKPDENGPLSSSESGFAELVQYPVPHFAVPFQKQHLQTCEDLMRVSDAWQRAAEPIICNYSKTD